MIVAAWRRPTTTSGSPTGRPANGGRQKTRRPVLFATPRWWESLSFWPWCSARKAELTSSGGDPALAERELARAEYYAVSQETRSESRGATGPGA